MTIHSLTLILSVWLSVRMIYVNDHWIFQSSKRCNSFDRLTSKFICFKYRLLVPVGPINVVFERRNTEGMPQYFRRIENRSYT